MGEKKKSKAHILKYVPCILKYLRPIFCPLKTILKHVPKRRTKTDVAFMSVANDTFRAVCNTCKTAYAAAGL